MPVASWMALAIALWIPVVAAVRRRKGKSTAGPALAMTTAAVALGAVGILN